MWLRPHCGGEIDSREHVVSGAQPGSRIVANKRAVRRKRGADAAMPGQTGESALGQGSAPSKSAGSNTGTSNKSNPSAAVLSTRCRCSISNESNPDKPAQSKLHCRLLLQTASVTVIIRLAGRSVNV